TAGQPVIVDVLVFYPCRGCAAGEDCVAANEAGRIVSDDSAAGRVGRGSNVQSRKINNTFHRTHLKMAIRSEEERTYICGGCESITDYEEHWRLGYRAGGVRNFSERASVLIAWPGCT